MQTANTREWNAGIMEGWNDGPRFLSSSFKDPVSSVKPLRIHAGKLAAYLEIHSMAASSPLCRRAAFYPVRKWPLLNPAAHIQNTACNISVSDISDTDILSLRALYGDGICAG